MITFPPAKINLGLWITGKRADGFHDLETCFYPVHDCCDALEMLETDADALEIKGMDWHEPMEKNLVFKAMELFREHEPAFPPKDWILLKKIPTGAGLGGGSSDAAYALRMMANFSGWSISDPRLQQMAAHLGSDCACFLHKGPTIGKGRGEILEPINLDLSHLRIHLELPGIHISTAEAFSRVKPQKREKSLDRILLQPIETWKTELHNDFEDSVFPLYPQLAEIKEKLYHNGALYASLSGSGSAVFGLFPK